MCGFPGKKLRAQLLGGQYSSGAIIGGESTLLPGISMAATVGCSLWCSRLPTQPFISVTTQ